jgi:hypothetical protein
MPTFTLDQIRLATTSKGNIVALFAYDIHTKEGIVGKFSIENCKMTIGRLPINTLTLHTLHEMNNMLTDERDPTGDTRMVVGWLMQKGISEEMWDGSLGLFDWKTMEIENNGSNTFEASVIVSAGENSAESPPVESTATGGLPAATSVNTGGIPAAQ